MTKAFDPSMIELVTPDAWPSPTQKRAYWRTVWKSESSRTAPQSPCPGTSGLRLATLTPTITSTPASAKREPAKAMIEPVSCPPIPNMR